MAAIIKEIRADRIFFANGFNSLRDYIFITSTSLMFKAVYIDVEGKKLPGYFVFDGFYRRIKLMDSDARISEFMALLDDAFPLKEEDSPDLHANFEERLRKALAYRKMNDAKLIAMNFELILKNIDTILGKKHYRNAMAHNLSFAASYAGSRMISATRLFKAWSEGKLRHPCPEDHRKNAGNNADENAGKNQENGYILYGAGGLSSGRFCLWCPECRKLKTVRGFFGQYFRDILKTEAYPTDGYRLDEIIEELGGKLPALSVAE